MMRCGKRAAALAEMRARGCVRIVERDGLILGWRRWSWLRGALWRAVRVRG